VKLRLAFPVLLALILFAPSALACEFLNEFAARASAVSDAGWYFLVTLGIGIAVVAVELCTTRRPIVIVSCALLIALHPSWTVLPAHDSACNFANVQLSEVDLAVMVCLLGYQILQFLRQAKTFGRRMW